MNLFETLKFLRPDQTPEQRLSNLKHDLEHLDSTSFYGSTNEAWEFELEAYGEDCTYILSVSKDFLNSEYYDIETPNHIIEAEDWKQDCEWLRSFMVNNIKDVKIY
ncbi:unnamed protein product [marine sediment metagenome]|uniref:Uncharacterized protein n=1 Tax=marine sediment metagenome TaxID=412755 RepID=X0WLT2_9ZZZZ